MKNIPFAKLPDDEEYKEPEFAIDEYGVEGVSFEYKEAEALHNRLMDLKKKYGISS